MGNALAGLADPKRSRAWLQFAYLPATVFVTCLLKTKQMRVCGRWQRQLPAAPPPCPRPQNSRRFPQARVLTLKSHIWTGPLITAIAINHC